MRKPVFRFSLLTALAIVACKEDRIPTGETPVVSAKAAQPLSGSRTERAAQVVAKVNARLEAAGSTVRLDEVWMFSLGVGTDPFRRLRTGSRWVNPRSVTYSIDGSDLIQYDPKKPGAPFTNADVLTALVRSHETYNTVRNIVLHSTRVADNGSNNDILDGQILDGQGNCIDVVDLTAATLLSYNPATGAIEFSPVADNLFGGWLAPPYFANCLGSDQILGVTYSFSDVDGALGDGMDGYRDRFYTEQFYMTCSSAVRRPRIAKAQGLTGSGGVRHGSVPPVERGARPRATA